MEFNFNNFNLIIKISHTYYIQKKLQKMNFGKISIKHYD